MRIQRKRSSRKGFTLIEIMLVVGIIAMLAVFVVPNLIGQREKAEVQMAHRLVGPRGELCTQIELYRMNMGKYPEELMDLVEPPEDEEDLQKWGEKYIKDPETLKDPWGNDLVYKAGDDAEVNTDSYDLCSMGPDGEEGGGDDICNYKSEE